MLRVSNRRRLMRIAKPELCVGKLRARLFAYPFVRGVAEIRRHLPRVEKRFAFQVAIRRSVIAIRRAMLRAFLFYPPIRAPWFGNERAHDLVAAFRTHRSQLLSSPCGSRRARKRVCLLSRRRSRERQHGHAVKVVACGVRQAGHAARFIRANSHHVVPIVKAV